MKEVLHYTFSKKAAAIQKMQLLLNHREDSLTLSVEGNSTLLSALDLFVKDENSNILFHRQLGTGENVITITNNVKKHRLVLYHVILKKEYTQLNLHCGMKQKNIFRMQCR